MSRHPYIVDIFGEVICYPFIFTIQRREAELMTTKSKSTQSSIASLMEIQPGIDEVLASGIPMSPVEPISPHIFCGPNPTKPEDRQSLKSTTTNMSEEPRALKSSKEETYHGLKSAVNGINRKVNSMPAPDNGAFEHLSSPKSHNASRTQQSVQQGQALYTHDLAGMVRCHRPNVHQVGTGWAAASTDIMRGPASRPPLHSACDAMDIVGGGECELMEGLNSPVEGGMSSRPKSTG